METIPILHTTPTLLNSEWVILTLAHYDQRIGGELTQFAIPRTAIKSTELCETSFKCGYIHTLKLHLIDGTSLIVLEDFNVV